jgi:hypothetical protein
VPIILGTIPSVFSNVDAWYNSPLLLDPCGIVIFVSSVLKTLGTM